MDTVRGCRCSDGQLSIGLLVLVIVGEGLADRRGDLKLFDRSTTYLLRTLHQSEYVLRKGIFIRSC